MKRQYLGDGLYMEFDGFHIWLISNDGVVDTNKVALDPDVLNEFVKQLKKLKLLNNYTEKLMQYFLMQEAVMSNELTDEKVCELEAIIGPLQGELKQEYHDMLYAEIQKHKGTSVEDGDIEGT